MKKTLVIYHGNCPDGFGAALAAWHKFGDDADYVAANYGQAPPDMAGREVVIVDFSYPRAVLEALHKEADSLLVIDHHKTAQADLAGLDYAYFDMDHSGAVLAWKTLHHDGCVTVPLLLQHIEDRDLWRFAMPGTQEISLALWTKPRTFDAWNRYLHDVSPLLAEGTAMLGYQNRLVEQMTENARWRAVGPHIVQKELADVYAAKPVEAEFRCSGNRVYERSLTWDEVASCKTEHNAQRIADALNSAGGKP